MPEGGCCPRYSQVIAEYTDIYGNRQRAVRNSLTVKLDDAGNRC